MPRLKEKVALITGAARGIGEAIARSFIAEGAFVYLTDIDDELGEPLAAGLGSSATYRRLDVCEEGDWFRVTSDIMREQRMKDFVGDTPMRRFGRPEEVAALALLLATDEAAYMTGAELTIDGGILAGSSAAPKPAEEPAPGSHNDKAD